jgi:hypothetical protein
MSNNYLLTSDNNNVKIAVNKSLLKEYIKSNERVVYLHDNTEFQLQLFNPFSYVIGVKIKFNDYEMSKSYLVLRPGERIWLDRFIDNDNKLLFSTYTVDDTNEAKQAIKNNGYIEVSFYREYRNSYAAAPYTTWASTPTCVDPFVYDYETTCTSVSADTYFSSNINTSTCSCNYCSSSPTVMDEIETGRIEQGSKSEQTFIDVNYDFESYAFTIEKIHLLPESQRPITSSNLNKKYCHACGRKLNTKFKYCPFCGEKQ